MLNTSMYVISQCTADELLIVLGKGSAPDAVVECCERKRFKRLAVCYYDRSQRNALSGDVQKAVHRQNENDIGQFLEMDVDELPGYRACLLYTF